MDIHIHVNPETGERSIKLNKSQLKWMQTAKNLVRTIHVNTSDDLSDYAGTATAALEHVLELIEQPAKPEEAEKPKKPAAGGKKEKDNPPF